MATMTMLVFEKDGAQLMLTEAEAIHRAMTNGDVAADTMVTVYCSDGSSTHKRAVEHKHLAAYFVGTPEQAEQTAPVELAPPVDLSPIVEADSNAPSPRPMAQSTAERLRALEAEIDANPDATASWAPRVEAARPAPAVYRADLGKDQTPSDIRHLGDRPAHYGGKSRVTAAVLALLFGGLGVHKFYMGKKRAGWIMLAMQLLGMASIGQLAWIVWTIAIVEAVIYFTQSDEEFAARYIDTDKEWF